jgi:peptidoglycan/LPS O-acetylase OafA/YrhL
MGRGTGAVLVTLGALVIGVGALYMLEEYAFGGAIFIWALMLGLTVAGVGVVVMRRSRLASFIGALVCATSLGLIVLWEIQVGSLEAWRWVCGVPAAIGLIVGLRDTMSAHR